MTSTFLFPVALQPIASRLFGELVHCGPMRVTCCATLSVNGELLSLPGRLYCPVDLLQRVVDRETGDARILAMCLGTRHWDGHVREAHLRRIVDLDRDWVVPFVVQLLGEYVVEIAQVIKEALARVDQSRYAAFARANPQFMELTRQRTVSYWDCYYRWIYKYLRDYPARAALDAIERMV
ncbi:hypothetical protein [Lysobacter gummosus]|uniref:hypothetical protein n=1 Tax=Lysobacter gummosus TaxID=262324 RepID=UPI0036400242